MPGKISLPTIILVTLILFSLSLAGGTFYLLQKEQVKVVILQQKLEDVTTKQKIAEAKLSESEKLIGELQVKLKDSDNQIETLTSSLEQEKTARQEALSAVEQLKGDLEKQKNLRQDLEKKLSQTQEEIKKAQTKLNELDAQKKDLEAKVKNLEEQAKNIELGTISVTPPAEAVPGEQQQQPQQQQQQPQPQQQQQALLQRPSLAPLEGKVLVVNKDYNFAVLNLGAKEGTKIGDVFSVYHNEQYLGDVKVEKLHEHMAAAVFVSGNVKDKVLEGDKVVQKVK